ncbi:hypothetical protein CALVIDRAFT_563964 [Calocera viscosa TUFC12733]|uniref:Uncharacterized protein n=1 Tax=Calocera viscosa (strain TUFC12733) TaxID=1330018 RepID=A0A167M9P1_CALVF|nr:hypothetical protein CALVIDRAFT_563964 [Calocera viscosa TUFC12733]
MVNFKGDQKAWLLEHLARFSQQVRQRQGKAYAKQICNAFKATFPDYLPKKDEENVDEQIYVFLKNNKAQLDDPLTLLSMPQEKLPPLMNQAREAMAADIPNFDQELAAYAASVKKIIFQARPQFLKRCWLEELSEERRKEYLDVAAKRRAENLPDMTSSSARWSSEQISRSISGFHDALRARTGWVCFSLAGGLDQSGVRAMTRVDSGRTPAGLGFSEFHLKYEDDVQQLWREFVKSAVVSAISNAPARMLPTLQHHGNNSPILPLLQSSWNRLDIAVVLSAFFQHLYEHEVGSPSLEWLSARVKPGRLPLNVLFRHPEDMTFVDLLSVYEHIQKQQAAHGEAYTFFDADDPAAPFSTSSSGSQTLTAPNNRHEHGSIPHGRQGRRDASGQMPSHSGTNHSAESQYDALLAEPLTPPPPSSDAGSEDCRSARPTEHAATLSNRQTAGRGLQSTGEGDFAIQHGKDKAARKRKNVPADASQRRKRTMRGGNSARFVAAQVGPYKQK